VILVIKNDAKLESNNEGKKTSPIVKKVDIKIALIATPAPNRYLKYPEEGDVIGSGSITSTNNKTVESVKVLNAKSTDEVRKR